jgi:hypothetical protein
MHYNDNEQSQLKVSAKYSFPIIVGAAQYILVLLYVWFLIQDDASLDNFAWIMLLLRIPLLFATFISCVNTLTAPYFLLRYRDETYERKLFVSGSLLLSLITLVFLLG